MRNFEYNKTFDGMSHYFVAYSSKGVGLNNFIDQIVRYRKYLGPGMCVMTFPSFNEAERFALQMLRQAMPATLPIPTSLQLGSLKTYRILCRDLEKAQEKAQGKADK